MTRRPVAGGLVVVDGTQAGGVHHHEPVVGQHSVGRVWLAAVGQEEQPESRVLLSLEPPLLGTDVEGPTVMSSVYQVSTRTDWVTSHFRSEI